MDADPAARRSALIGTTNPGTTEQEGATRFFTDVAGALQRTGARPGVEHIVTLSIVGIDKTSFGYYAAKLEHERAAASGPASAGTARHRRSARPPA